MKKFPYQYKALRINRQTVGDFQIVPIRYGDRQSIRKWRNEQIYHLRQTEPLTAEQQDRYFQDIVAPLFRNERPPQLLFSLLKNNECIGYGGLVHINWRDRHAEVSFIMKTSLEKEHFEYLWSIFLQLLQPIAFEGLGLHKLFTYAYDLRSRLYIALDEAGFRQEARLEDHCFFEGQYIPVLIHGKVDKHNFRRAVITDIDVTYDWVISPKTRKYSFNANDISYEEHMNWFPAKIDDSECLYLILENGLGTALGSIRVDRKDGEGLISYVVDDSFHGRGLGTKLVVLLLDYLKKGDSFDAFPLVAYVKKDNAASVRIFEKLGFSREELVSSYKFEMLELR